MRKATTSSFFAGKFSRWGKVPVRTARRFCAGALCAALVLTGVSVPQKSASAAGAKLNKNSVVLYVGGNATAKIKAKNVSEVTFKSKDESVAKVNKNTGKITGIGAGTTKVVAKTDVGKLKCAVRVYKAIKTLTTDTTEVTLAPGETQTVSVGVKPAKANDTMWEVATSDKSVAKKQKGNGTKGTFDIIGVGEGTATITISSTDGGSAPDATVKVNVVAAEGENTAGKDTEETETPSAEDEDTVGEDTEDTEDTEETETPSQAEIVIKENTAPTDAEGTEETEADSAPTDSEGAEDENAAGEEDAAETTGELVSLALAAPATRVHDGEGATIGVNGIFENGTIIENISVAKLEEELGSEALNNISVTASEVESSDELEDEREENTVEDISISSYAAESSSCSLDLSGETAVIEWTDTVTNPYEDQNIFDDTVRTIELEVSNSPIDFEGLDLEVCDPSRPVSVELSDWNTGAIRVQGTDAMVKFIDQYGETMAEDVDDMDEMENVISFFSNAMSDGYMVNGETSYFGIALVSEDVSEDESVKIGTFGKVDNIYSDYGITWGLAEDETINNTSIEIAVCSGEDAGNGVSAALEASGEPAGGKESLGTVENVVCTYTFTASDVDGTLTYSSGSWSFAGTISGSVSEVRKGGFVGYELDGSATAYFTDGESVSVSIVDKDGKECAEDANCSDHGGSKGTFTASFSVSVTSVSVGEDGEYKEYEVNGVDVCLSASAKGQSTYTVRSCFSSGASVSLSA